MAEEATTVCADHPDRFDCPDCLIYHDAELGEYGLIVHDGGRSYIGIAFCPFCGTQLSE